LLLRTPAKGNLSGEAKAPAGSLLLQLPRSASSSVSVGKRKLLGHGLFTPFTPCQRFVFAVLRQSYGELVVVMKLPFTGTSPLLNVEVVTEVLHWCPSLLRPHWYKSP
jgi:hypothetical protein